MSIGKLVMMANQIAQFYNSYPHDEAVAGTAAHIESYWTPNMRGALRDVMHEVPGLDPIVIEAFSPGVEGCPHPGAPGRIRELGVDDAG